MVVPEIVIVLVFDKCSSSGEVMMSWGLSAAGCDGVGLKVISFEIGVGVGLVSFLGKFLRLLFAVQMPRVMISPRMNPIMMARKNSFFIRFD